jgi:predicted TIM-barrel fold metal-dependent hydrolase
MYKIFDVHTHTYPPRLAEKAAKNLGEFYSLPIEGKGTYDELEEESVKCGVVGFLLFSVTTNAHQVEKVNDGIAALVEYSRSRGLETYGFAGMHQDHADFAAELDRIEKMGLRGIKIHPDIQGVNIDDPRMYKLYELMEGRLPLYLHMGDDRPQYRFSETDRLVKVKEDFPKLEVVAAHLGGYRAWDEAYKLTKFDGMWYDTSSALWEMTPEYATELIKRLGTDRVMYGTDYPVVLPENEIERFMKLGLNEKEREDIFYGNAKRFLKF